MAQCIGCGFLAMRNLQTRELCESELEYRTTGTHPRMLTLPKNVYSDTPICFQMVLNFDLLYDWSETNSEKRNEILLEERDCNSFTPWQQGFTPKEHREMLDRERLLNWQASREDADRKWREDQDQKRDERQAALLWQLAGVAGVFTLIGAAAGALIAAWLSH